MCTCECGPHAGGPLVHPVVIASERAAHLVEQLRDASNALIGLAERIPAQRWLHVATPREWSPGKDAEHVAHGNALHQWIVRSSLHQQSGTRPLIERVRLTAQLAQPEVIGLLKQRAEESSSLLESLTDQQLALACRNRTLGEFIERVLIQHYRTHQAAIERKLRRAN
jgi:DinB superfamily